MTDEEINIAIAQACGWVKIYKSSPLGCTGQLVGLPPNAMPTFENECLIPDYTNDLNAMHTAEMTMSKYLIFRNYEAMLDRVVPMSERWIFATARQRAEAYLKTLKLWKYD